MSYLDGVRLHFSGDFRADVSTVNNDSGHFDNDTFKPNDQLPGPGASNGWWQPAGTGAWRLNNCRITGGAGTDALDKNPKDDPVIGLQVADTGDQVSAKIVDLDPNQQMVSTIFGLEMRIIDTSQKKVLVSGKFKPAAFYDIWSRGTGGGGDIAASVFYQSVLTDVVWADVGFSPVLTALRAASEPGFLSVRFMTDGYALGGVRRGYGRIVGTFGPHRAGEPSHCVVCRLDPDRRQVLVDFGNAIQTSGTLLSNAGDLHLVVLGPDRIRDLGTLTAYTAQGWYEATGGIHAFPVDAQADPAIWAEAESSPLAIVAPAAGQPGQFVLLAREPQHGIYARPDDFVVRLETGASQDVPIIVTEFGKPRPGATIELQVSDFNLMPTNFPLATPADALKVTSTGMTGADGRAVVRLTGSDPNHPRDYIDGQVYAVEVRVKGFAGSGTDFDQSCFISVLVFDRTEVPNHVDWQRDVLPILQQYANLYPRPHGPDRYVPFANRPPLHPVVNLADPAAVARFAGRIHGALSLPFDHPNHMPVVRDLSHGRRAILLKWMEQMIAGEPIPPPAPSVSAGMAVAAADPPVQPGDLELAPLGGKTEAMLKVKRRGPSAPSAGS